MNGRIYISGPMTGKHLWNWPAFERAESILRADGWDVVSPARVDEEQGLVTVHRRPSHWYWTPDVVTSVEVPEAFDFRDAIERDLELVEGCTAIYLLKGWDESLGAGIELDRALRLGLEVLVEPGARRPACLIPQDQAADLDDLDDFDTPFQPGPHEDDIAFATDRDELDDAEVRDAWRRGDLKVAGYPANLHADYIDALRPGRIVEAEKKAKADFIERAFKAGLVDVGGEVRVTDPETGGQKGSKLARYDLIPHEALHALAEHFGRGAEKYDDRNWERGYDWALTFAALNRHLWAWWGGEDVDPETGSSHMTAVAWHAFVAVTFQARGLGTDTRPPVSQAAFDRLLA